MGSRWLFSRSIDLLVLFLPVWITWVVCFALPDQMLERALPLWVWAVFIVGVDVSHVWSTLFRTYLDREEFASHRTVLIRTPILAFCLFFAIAGFSSLWFWRVMAYLALFHFVKQQYGYSHCTAPGPGSGRRTGSSPTPKSFIWLLCTRWPTGT